MRFALTGAGGLLGSTVVHEMARRGLSCIALGWQDVLTSKPSDVAMRLKALGITHLVHSAAQTNLERGELESAATYRDNTTLSELLAASCAMAGVRMVFISSTGVYGAWKTDPYVETDFAQPTTVHHRSKYLAELGITAITSGALVLRTGWLFGGSISGKRDFVTGRIYEAHNEAVVISNTEQFGCPTYTLDVVRTLLSLVDGGFAGTFNCVNAGRASRFDYVSEIYRLAGIRVQVDGRPASAFNRVAPVSNNEAALCTKLDDVGVGGPEDWRVALARYMRDYRLISK